MLAAEMEQSCQKARRIFNSGRVAGNGHGAREKTASVNWEVSYCNCPPCRNSLYIPTFSDESAEAQQRKPYNESPSAMKGPLDHGLATFVTTVFRLRPTQFLVALALMLTCGALQGIGLLLLLPLLAMAGVRDAGGGDGLTGHVEQAFRLVGLAPSLEIVMAAFLLLVTGFAAVLRLQAIVTARLRSDVTKQLQDRLYESIVRMSWLSYIHTRSSDYQHAATNEVGRIGFALLCLMRLAAAVLLTFVYLVLCCAVSPLLTGLTLLCAGALWPILLRQNRAAQAAGRQQSGAGQRLYGQLTDHLAGLREVKSFGVEEESIAAFCRKTSAARDSTLNLTRADANTSLVYKLGSAIMLSGLVYVTIRWLAIPLTEVLLVVLLFARTFPRIQEIHQGYQQLLHAIPAFESVMQMQARCDGACESLVQTRSPILSPSQAIELHGVGFRYDQSGDTWALRNVNLTVPTGRTTAVVGSSGAGKSTLADLLMGLLMPCEGKILFGDQVVTADNLLDWRKSIGYVPQDSFLLHASVRENLVLAKADATEGDLWRALEQASAGKVVSNLPRGLDSVIGDRGVRLSGGERQRLAIARALLRQPSILILDEATSALDGECQLAVQQALGRLHGQVTIVVIAHRLSTIRNADQIVVLAKGRVVEVGAFADLAKQSNGMFRSLVRADTQHDAA